MKTNSPEINTAESADDGVKCKRKWVKPEVEVISKDLIQGGIISYINEAHVTTNGFGFRGQFS